MNRKLLIPAIILLLPLMWCSCAKVHEELSATEHVTITASVEDTRVSLTQGDNKLTLSWQEGDALNVIGSTTEKYSIIDESIDGKTAKFSGNQVKGSSFDIIFPAKYASSDAIGARSYVGQVQNGNGSTAHLEYNAIIEGASSYKNISFVKGASGCKINGAVKIVVTLPVNVSSVESITISADDNLFYSTNASQTPDSKALTLGFTDTKIDGTHTLTAYMMTSWQDATIPAGTKLTVDVTVPEQKSHYCKTFHCPSAQKISGGSCFTIDLQNAYLTYSIMGNGTASDPYLLASPYDLLQVKSLCEAVGSVDDNPTYFKMVKDINMAGMDWEPVNWASPYMKKIDFNGNGKTISNLTVSGHNYPSLFGVVFGEVYNLKIANASVDGGGMAAGIVGGYAGTGNNYAKIHDVHVSGTVTGTVNGIGGFVGRVGNADIFNCSADVQVTYAGNYGSAFVGYFEKNAVNASIKNCFAKGSVRETEYGSGKKAVGGIVGGVNGKNQTVENCICIASVSGGNGVGGVVGMANYDASSKQTNLGNKIKGCIAWNDVVEATKMQIKNYSSGAVVGYTATDNYLQNCWRKNGFNLTINKNQTDRSAYPENYITPVNQGDSSPSSPLTVGIDCNYNDRQITPYHGKAASAGETASDIARKIGWDEGIWDLSGDIPVLRGSDITADSGSGEDFPEYIIPGDDIPDHSPVAPDGKTGWTRTDVETGLIFWQFSGTDPVSGQKQIVSVADLDLSQGYKVKMFYDSNKSTASAVHKKYNAVATINGGYGASQVFFKVDGYAHARIKQEKDDDGILNWRNDGAICVNEAGRPFIANSIFSQDGDGQSEYGQQLNQQREFYRQTLSGIPDIISGAPLLIDGYNPLGLTFVPVGITISQAESNYAYEHPYRHQGVRHPRSAVAVTGDNHLLLIVADGRRNGYCIGFTAKELTQFLIKNFDPKYALNLDGGGSSTLCIKDCGKSDTHVVNYPCEGITNKNLSYTQERNVQSFLYVTK